MLQRWIESIDAWLKQPFREEMNAVDWFLFLGLVIAIMVLWQMVLHTIRQGLEAA